MGYNEHLNVRKSHILNLFPLNKPRLFSILFSAFTNELKVPGLFPPIFNVASKSSIVVNATCGEVGGPEVYCKLKEHRGKADTQCSVCDASSSSPGKKHSIRYALEQNNMNWWQSPTLHQGPQYEYVTITLDMKQVSYLLSITKS